MAYVLVDADALETLNKYATIANDLFGSMPVDPEEVVGMRFPEALAPVVPELPEGWMVDFEMDHQVAVRNADVWATIGAPGMEAYKSGTDTRVDFFPYEVLPYLLARWQSLQGGA